MPTFIRTTNILAWLCLFWMLGCETGDVLEDGDGLQGRDASSMEYQAESATSKNGCSVATNNAGYTGSGFMRYGGNGTWIEWNNVKVVTAGEYELTFRYAVNINSRPGTVLINGVDVGRVSFSATGSWTTWKTVSITQALKAGNNTIRVLAKTNSGGPNLDKMDVLFKGGAGGPCALVNENGTANLSCPSGQVIAGISFASYGTPTGLCPSFTASACHAPTSKSKVESACLNKQSCSIGAKNSVFGDPCGGTYKKLAVVYSCSASGTSYEELQSMLKQCRTQISSRLPAFDPSARDAFMASHRAESNSTGTIKDSGYSDAGEVAKTVALARPLLDAPNLARFMVDKTLDATLVRCAVLANIFSHETEGAPELGTADLGLISELLQDQDLMKQILVAGGPRGNRYGKALQIYKELQSANPRAKGGLFQRLALAIGLELAAPDLWINYEDIDPQSRYRFYEDSYLQGELIAQFAGFSPWEYRQVINAEATDEDLLWLREMLHNLRPDFIFNSPDHDRFVGIQSVEELIPQEVVQFDENLPYSWFAQVVAKGGQCGAKARFARSLLNSFGVPAWGFQVPKHAGIGHWTPSGWDSNLKVQWERGYLKMGPRSEWMMALLFLLDAHARSVPDEYLKALRLQWIGDVLGEEDIDLMFAGLGGLWNALALNKKRIIDKDLYVNPPGIGWKAIPTPTESDKEMTTHANGTMTIPAVAIVDKIPLNGTLKIIVDRNDDFLLHYQRDEDIVPFSYIVDVPRAGSYTLRAEVVTVLENQSFVLTVNNAQPAKRLELPYTVGMWETSKPVTVSLVQGQNKLTFSRLKPENLGSAPMWWYCMNNSDPGCGGITIKSVVLTPL